MRRCRMPVKLKDGTEDGIKYLHRRRSFQGADIMDIPSKAASGHKSSGIFI